MKKINFLTGLVLMMLTISSCGNSDDSSISKEMKESQTIQEEYNEHEKQEETDNQESTENNINKENENNSESQVDILSLQKQYFTHNIRMNGMPVVMCKNNNLTLCDSSEKYQRLQQSLSEMAGMQKRTYDDEADNILAFVNEMGLLDEKQISTLDLQVRRADSIAVSFLADSYADYGFIDDDRSLWGSNYDSQTGAELKLSDVIVNMEPIPKIVLNEINSHLMSGEDYSEETVENYFKNVTSDGISWTLDYDGVSFYFSESDFDVAGNSPLTAKVSFEKYPELFNPYYTEVPDAYMVRMPLDLSFYTDLDSDGDFDALQCTGFKSTTDSYYTDFGIYTEIDGYYHYEELFAYEFQPYYVKTSDNNHYIYLFCEESEYANRQIKLVVYCVNNSHIERIGELNVGPSYIMSDTFILPLDPNNLLLDDNDDMMNQAAYFYVGSNGMPAKTDVEVQRESFVEVSSVEEFLEAVRPETTILFKPGYYNFSTYIEDIWAKEGDAWNRYHEFIKLRECFDGSVEVMIQNVDDLCIIGNMEHSVITELVVETRYGAVLNFDNCKRITLKGLTMGHTQEGTCEESVIAFEGCSDISLTDMDLYGCGMYGFKTKEACGNFFIQNCILRECEGGPFWIENPIGKFEFRNCKLIDSNAGGYYEFFEKSELCFIECSFGTCESNYWYFDEYATFIDCIFSDITMYPDIEPDLE